ncbi:uncharacterized protein LOC128216088 [Mya arenaria]|uniref:uncharacterized protein LOC128216088 n=1 Tax=Mya arenaria TaxID=6604 RepID=UPI0022E893E4|nr:uncharacterized protein LOC128216088 [Mya arenaria]
MASNFEPSIQSCCDFIYDFSCSPCEENGFNTEAHHYCTQCTKYYCENCVSKHNGLYQKHAVLGREDVKKWEAAPGVVDSLMRCVRHNGEELKLVCGDHDQLCCQICVAVEHRNCSKIQHIPDVAKGIQGNVKFQQITKMMAEVQERLEKMKESHVKNTTSLKRTRSAISDEIKTKRNKINTILDNIEKTTLGNLEEMITELDESLKTDIKTCTQMNIQLQHMIDTFQMKAESSESKSYIAYRKSQDFISQANYHLRGKSVIESFNVTFQENYLIEELLSLIKIFGKQTLIAKQPEGPLTDLNHVFNIAEKKEYNVKMNDEGHCFIHGVCEMPSGEFVIADKMNCKVKLLDKECRVLDHCDVPAYPSHVCHIDGNEVAVCHSSYDDEHEIHFIKATNGKLVTTRKLSFKHRCYAAAYHGGLLYVSSGYALYVYTMSGQKVKKLYKDTDGDKTVVKFVLSNDGKTIYITNKDAHQLITLDNNGNKLASITDPDMKKPTGVHVTPAGHVFVCCYDSGIVMQVDTGLQVGKAKLITLAREKDGLESPRDIYFSTHTSSLVVGGYKDTLLVFKII